MALKVSFQESVQDELLRFAVIIAVYEGKVDFLQTPGSKYPGNTGRTPGRRRNHS